MLGWSPSEANLAAPRPPQFTLNVDLDESTSAASFRLGVSVAGTAGVSGSVSSHPALGGLGAVDVPWCMSVLSPSLTVNGVPFVNAVVASDEPQQVFLAAEVGPQMLAGLVGSAAIEGRGVTATIVMSTANALGAPDIHIPVAIKRVLLNTSTISAISSEINAVLTMALARDPQRDGSLAALLHPRQTATVLANRGTLAHSSIVGYYGIFYHEGCVNYALEKRDKALSSIGRPLRDEHEVRMVVKEVLDGLSFLHGPTVRLVHNDLKPANILANFCQTADGTVATIAKKSIRLCDFGCAVALPPDSDHILCAPDALDLGTLMYKPPERLCAKPGANGYLRYSDKADIWSLGITAFELLTGKLLFATTELVGSSRSMHLATQFGMGQSHIHSLIHDVAQHHPVPVSIEFLGFLCKCLTLDDGLRPSAASLLHHPFLKSSDW